MILRSFSNVMLPVVITSTTTNVLMNVLQDGMKMLLDGVLNVDVHVILALDQEIHVINVKEIQH